MALRERSNMSATEAPPILRLEITVHENSVYEDSQPILQKVRPDWTSSREPASENGSHDSSSSGGGDHDEIKMKVFSGGISNKLVGFFKEKDPEDIVIVKMYGEGTEMFIDRIKEIETMKRLHERKCGPILYAVFENGIAYEYSPGVILSATSCRSPQVYSLVAKEMARMHSIPLSPAEYNDEPAVWKILDKFQSLSQEVLRKNPELKHRLGEIGLTEDWGQSAIDELKYLCSKESIPIAFCHNDLLLGNIIYDENKSQVSFIDFEHGAPNYIAFDIANHFNEFAGVDEVDFSNCPDENFIRTWLAEYFQSYENEKSNADATISALDMNVCMHWIQLCMPLSHLLWILWSILQAHYSTIDFDFVNYIGQRFPEYNNRMKYVQELN